MPDRKENPMVMAANRRYEASPRDRFAQRYQEVRHFTEELCSPLVTEDYLIQSMPDVSPTRWHVAHVTWFFETFLLQPNAPDYRPFHPQFSYLFNSYYNAVGERHPRPERGLVSRPTVAEIYQYRHYVDSQVLSFLDRLDERQIAALAPILDLGFHHEQQHQELILMDIKHVFSINPIRPAYRTLPAVSNSIVRTRRWCDYPGGLVDVGHDGQGFAFDNEGPRHKVYLAPFRLASQLVTNGEFLAFIEDGGYRRPDLWLSDGWNTIHSRGWDAPFYWEDRDGEWHEMTLGGLRPLNRQEPVVHVSFYEADAYARWAGVRLPSEFEWEIASVDVPVEGNFVEDGRFHPTPVGNAPLFGGPVQMYGDVWEWTRSPYSPFPGFAPAAGAVGEYNGKFMINQMVLRGGACVTSFSHIRPTYRNFFPPDARWAFSGIRLASDT